MKIKKIFTLLMLMAGGLASGDAFLSAQTIKFDMGPELKLAKGTSEPGRFLAGNTKNIYLIQRYGSHRSSGQQLEIYDGKLNLTGSKAFETNVKDLRFHDLIWMKDKFIMLTNKYDKTTKENTAYGSFVDTKGNVDPKAVVLMKMVGAPNKPNSVSWKGWMAFSISSNNSAFDFSVSDDSSKLLVYGYPPFNKNESQKIVFSVYDNNLVKQWEKMATMPYRDEMIDIMDQTVSNNGDVYILIKKYDGEKPKEVKKGAKGKEANYKYEVLAYTNGGEGYKEFVLDLGGKFVKDPTFKADSKGNLAVAGFYTDIFGGNEKGIFYMSIDGQSKSVKTSSTKEFTSDILQAFGKRKDEKKDKGKDQGLSHFIFRDFILREDGGAVILAENYYVVTNYYVDSHGMVHETHTYYYNDIIAINVNPEGQIQWFSRIPKKQVTGVPSRIFSFSSFVVGSKIYLVYNDNKKNVGDSDKLKNFSYKDGVAVIVTIDENGKLTKKNLFSLKDDKTILLAQEAQQISPNKMAVSMQKGKNYRLGTITVE